MWWISIILENIEKYELPLYNNIPMAIRDSKINELLWGYILLLLNEHYDIDRVELINVEELNDNQRRLLSEGGVCGTSVGYFINVNTTTEYVGMHTLIKNIL